MSCNHKFRYVITGKGMMALAVHSDLNWIEFEDCIKRQTNKIHPKGADTIWRWGTIEFINPQIKTADSFLDFCPALIGVE